MRIFDPHKYSSHTHECINTTRNNPSNHYQNQNNHQIQPHKILAFRSSSSSSNYPSLSMRFTATMVARTPPPQALVAPLPLHDTDCAMSPPWRKACYRGPRHAGVAISLPLTAPPRARAQHARDALPPSRPCLVPFKLTPAPTSSSSSPSSMMPHTSSESPPLICITTTQI